MALTVTEGELLVYHTDSDSDDPDLRIRAGDTGDFSDITVRERLQNRVDSTDITLRNNAGQYTGKITHGDRIVFRASDSGNPTGYSRGPYSLGSYSDIDERWTGIVDGQIEYNDHGAGNYTMDFSCADFVFWVLQNRIAYESFQNTLIAGDEDAIIDTILRRKAPEIDPEWVEDVETTADWETHGENLLDAFVELAELADATMYGNQNNFAFRRLDDIEPSFELTEDDFFTMSKAENDDELYNDVRIDAAEDHAPDPIGHQETIDRMQLVREENDQDDDGVEQLLYQFEIAQSRIERIQLYTDRVEGSDDGLIVRLQPDVDGEPADPGNRQQDIDRKQLEDFVIGEEIFTDFELTKERYPGRDPWLIVESDGEDGQLVGVRDIDNAPAFRAHYPFPISVSEDDQDSIDKYRHREEQIKDESLNTFTAARDIAEQKIKHYSVPTGTVQFEAMSPRAHYLQLADVITLDYPKVNAVGDYIITEKEEDFDGSLLRTTFTAMDTDAF